MSGSWVNVAGQYIQMSAGGAAAVGSGAHTIVALWQTSNDFNFNGSLASGYNNTTVRRDLFISGGHVFGGPSDSGGSVFGTPRSNATWYVSAVSKPAGSAHPRYHDWTYAADGSGTMNHGEATTSANLSDLGVLDQFHIGDGETKGNGLIAVVGLWTSALTDANLDTLKSGHLSAWAALSPAELISLQNWNGSTGATAVVGASTQTALVGTVGVGANPPSFDFTVGGVAGVAPSGTAVAVTLGLPRVALGGIAAAGVHVPVAPGTPRVGAQSPIVTRPNTGTVTRPFTGVVARP